MDTQQAPENKKSKYITYLKKIGLIGFLFFLIKGLVWLFLGKMVLKYFQSI